jgi:hypothetical protein
MQALASFSSAGSIPDPTGAAAAATLRGRYWLTRHLFLRALGFIYLIAFLVAVEQLQPLVGADGLLPAPLYLHRVASYYGDGSSAFAALPTLFWLDCSDDFMQGSAYAGLGLSLLLFAGFANAPLLAVLWFLYLSFVHVGQLFWGYGWESLLLETGFLAIFLCPVLDPRPLRESTPPPVPVIWLLRWVLFRVMFGAGLIKLRGDPCWRNLTCMMYHYETQPLPNPLSWYLHHMPPAFHRLEVLFNHFVELIVPWTLFAPRRIRHIGGLFLVAFQVLLILSGNLSWLNWLTLTLCIAAFDDRALSRLFPARLQRRLLAVRARDLSSPRRAVTYALCALVAYLSINPVLNMLSSRQVMNSSFDALELVNTYGAFGSVTRHRREIILEGTTDDTVTESTRWRPYEFVCKPGRVDRRPCVIAPYQPRLDWQIWFSAMGDYRSSPWLLRFIDELLRGNPGAVSLLEGNPFPHGPPKFIRAQLYEYQFTSWGTSGGAWWKRKVLGAYLPPLSRDDPRLREFLREHGWEQEQKQGEFSKTMAAEHP